MKKTSSKVIRAAAARAAGLKPIDPALDLGNTMTLPSPDPFDISLTPPAGLAEGG
jgi:hypothetical protein